MKIAICDDDKNELFRILSVLADYQTQRNIEFSYKPFDNSTELASNLLQAVSYTHLTLPTILRV